MAMLYFGNEGILFPSPKSYVRIRDEAADYIRSAHGTGVFTDRDKINTIIRDLAQHFEQQLDSQILPYLNEDFVYVWLAQYDQLAKVRSAYRAGKLSEEEEKMWKKISRNFGRTVKFILERSLVLGLQPKAVLDRKRFPEECSDLLAIAEQLVDLNIQSDQVYLIFPTKSELELSADNEHYYQLRISDADLKACTQDYGGRVQWEDENAGKLVPELKTVSHDYDPVQQATTLDAPFKAEIGATYTDIVAFLVQLPGAGGSSPSSCPANDMVQQFAKGLNMPESVVKRIIDGFSMDGQRVSSENNREYWNPRVEYRAYRRALFEFETNGKKKLLWSQEMAAEAVQFFLQLITYQNLCTEWQSKDTKQAVVDLSTVLGKWFEQLVCTHLTKAGLPGVSSRTGIGAAPNRIEFTPGEIDFLGYYPPENLLLVGECKRVLSGSEPKFFYQDITKFATGPKSYASKLRDKCAFVKNNAGPISQALSAAAPHGIGIEVKPTHIASFIVTRHPSVASCFIPDIPCVSLAELLSAISSDKHWPYAKAPL